MNTQDRPMNQEQKRWIWVEQTFQQLFKQNQDQRQAIDVLYLHIAVFARALGLDAQKVVSEIRQKALNYAFLVACDQEEQKVNAELAKKMEEDALKQKEELSKAGIIPQGDTNEVPGSTATEAVQASEVVPEKTTVQESSSEGLQPDPSSELNDGSKS